MPLASVVCTSSPVLKSSGTVRPLRLCSFDDDMCMSQTQKCQREDAVDESEIRLFIQEIDAAWRDADRLTDRQSRVEKRKRRDSYPVVRKAALHRSSQSCH